MSTLDAITLFYGVPGALFVVAYLRRLHEEGFNPWNHAPYYRNDD